MKNLFKFFINLFTFNFSAKNDLLCADEIEFPSSPICGKTNYQYPKAFIFGKPGAVITAVGTVPTAAEIATALLLSDDDKLFIINPISDGKKTPTPIFTKDENGLDQKTHEEMLIEGNDKYLNDDKIDMYRQLEVYGGRLQFWEIDALGRLYGGTTGYRVSASWPTMPTKENGYGNLAFIPIKIQWIIDTSKIFETAVDPDNLDLDNA